jgi:hypothetical protein
VCRLSKQQVVLEDSRQCMPIDSFLTFLVNPGELQLVDTRSLQRIRESLIHAPDVLVWEQLPWMVAPLLGLIKAKVLVGDELPMQTLMVGSWWEYNK